MNCSKWTRNVWTSLKKEGNVTYNNVVLGIQPFSQIFKLKAWSIGKHIVFTNFTSNVFKKIETLVKLEINNMFADRSGLKLHSLMLFNIKNSTLMPYLSSQFYADIKGLQN